MKTAEQIYVPVCYAPMRIRKHSVRFGIFVCVRWLFSRTAEDGLLWQRYLYYALTQIIPAPAAIAIDLLGIATYGAAIVIWWLLKEIYAGFKKMVLELWYAVKPAIQRFLVVTATITSLVLITIFMYERWDDLTDVIDDFGDLLF